MTEIIIKAMAASPGLGMATLWRLRKAQSPVIALKARGDTAYERDGFAQASAQTGAQLEALAHGSETMAAEMLEFQIAMLEDLADLALAAIDEGASAHDAWSACLDSEVETYRSSGDETLVARVGDLDDLKERLLRNLSGNGAQVNGGWVDLPDLSILLADDLKPTEFLGLPHKRLIGIALEQGNPSSHVSLLAKARGIPMLVGCGYGLRQADAGQLAVIDTEAACLIVGPNPGTVVRIDGLLKARDSVIGAMSARLHEPAVTKSGERINVCANIDDVSLLSEVTVDPFDGVGLVRTEFMFTGSQLPDEEQQYRTYVAIVSWAAGRSVTFRTLDAGGDKPVVGLSIDHEDNPFLGLRGYRLTRAYPDVFATQLRALLRASALGPTRIMLPMVTQPGEFLEFRATIDGLRKQLVSRGIVCGSPALGIMIEVPAAALIAGSFDVDFMSIGSNDLIQYLLARSRDNASLDYLSDDHPAIDRMIEWVVGATKEKGIGVSVCGDMASTPVGLRRLLRLGVRNISVALGQIALVKSVISELELS